MLMITTWQRIYTRYLKVNRGLFHVSLVPMMVMVSWGDEYQGTESNSDKVPLHNLFIVLDVLIRHRADLPLWAFLGEVAPGRKRTSYQRAQTQSWDWKISQMWYVDQSDVPFGDLSIEETGNIVKLKVQLEISPTWKYWSFTRFNNGSIYNINSEDENQA